MNSLFCRVTSCKATANNCCVGTCGNNSHTSRKLFYVSLYNKYRVFLTSTIPCWRLLLFIKLTLPQRKSSGRLTCIRPTLSRPTTDGQLFLTTIISLSVNNWILICEIKLNYFHSSLLQQTITNFSILYLKR